MKQFLGALVLSLIVSTSAGAVTTIPWTKEGCESVKGKWLTAHAATDSGCDSDHCNGKNFCRSNVNLNWFNALTWCQSIGHKLVSFDHLCPGIPTGPNGTSGACANVKGLDSGCGAWKGWTSMPWGSTEALQVSTANGSISTAGRQTRGGNCLDVIAVCEE